MSADNAKLIAELLQRIDAVLATYIDEPIFDLLADCRAALSAQSEPEPLTGGEFDRMMQYRARKEAAAVGWVCPACHCVNGPNVRQCPCKGNRTLRERITC